MKTAHSITSIDAMNALASDFSLQLREGDVVWIDGPLGAGKTHFVKALALALGFTGTVSSPTFPLLHEYRWAGQVLYHLDFYRLESLEEIYRAGLEDYLPGDGIALVEWASRFPEVIKNGRWKVEIKLFDNENREVTIESFDS